MRPRAAVGARLRSAPSIRTSPPWGRKPPETILRKVVFPEPLMPKRATGSPAATVRSIPSRAVVAPNRRVTPRAATRGGASTSLLGALGQGVELLHECDRFRLEPRLHVR